MNNPVTRIEVEYRPRGGNPLPENLFDGVSVEVWPSTKRRSASTRAAVAYARSASPAERESIRLHGPLSARALIERVEPLVPSLGEIYRTELPRLVQEYEHLMRLGGSASTTTRDSLVPSKRD